MPAKRWMLGGLLASLLLVLILIIAGPRPQQGQERPIRVVASLNFYAEPAQAVAGKYGRVKALINSDSVDPHDFQPTIRQSQLVDQANVLVANGLGYDHWLDKMAASGDHAPRIIHVGTQIAGRHSGDNEHVWYQPGVMEKLTRKYAQEFSEIDPQYRDYYHRRAQAYLQKLGRLQETMNKAKQGAQGQLVDVSEPVADYMLQALGYRINDLHYAKAIDDGNDPSPKDVARLQDDIVHHRIAFFVNNKQASGSGVKNVIKLARQHHVPVLNVTESKPNDKTYVEWMQSQLDALIKIQERGS